MIQRVLIVGSGSAGKRHLEVARQMLPKADLRVLRRQRANGESNLSNGCFYEVEAALRFSPQIAVIANPAPFHVEISNRLTSAGCHLLIEKPVASGIRGVKTLLKNAETHKIVLKVGYNLRFLNSLRKFRHKIRSGVIGRILSFHAEVGQYLPFWRPGVDYRKTVSANANLGGGVLLELSHEIDYLRWIFGPIKWVSAWCGSVGKLDIDVEDSAKITLGFTKGIMARGAVGTLGMDFIRKDSARFCHAIGDRGSLRWSCLSGKIEKYFQKEKKWKIIFKSNESSKNSYLAQMKKFLTCVKKNQKLKNSGKEALEVLKIIEAIKKSNRQKCAKIFISKIKT